MLSLSSPLSWTEHTVVSFQHISRFSYFPTSGCVVHCVVWEEFYLSVRRADFSVFVVKIFYILPSHVGCHDFFLSHSISIKLILRGVFSLIPVTKSSLLGSDFHLFPALSFSRCSSSLCSLLWEWALQWVTPYITIAISYYGNHNRNFINCSFQLHQVGFISSPVFNLGTKKS